jgi:hypothetical protein
MECCGFSSYLKIRLSADLALLPAVCLSCGLAWRDSAVLRWLDVGILLHFFYLGSLSMRGMNVVLAGLSQYLRIFVILAEGAAARPIELLFQDMRWKDLLPRRFEQHLPAVLRGIAIAVPLLIIFGSLFLAADAAFEGLVKHGCQFDLSNTSRHIFLALSSFWFVAGFFQTMFTGNIRIEWLWTVTCSGRNCTAIHSKSKVFP